MTGICLNMIVKDEASVITRCLASVKPWIEHWVIVDTGSTDGTQAIIREYLADIPGQLVERPWRNFGANRTEALELARGKAEYILFMDADNIFCVPPGWQCPPLKADAYHVTMRSAQCEYVQTNLVADRLRWYWVGVVHEYLTVEVPYHIETLRDIWIDRRHEGARSRDPDTFRKDAAALEAALLDEPDNARYAFYLAQSWRDAGEPAKAREAYRQRAAMGGWEEEVWYSLYEIANLNACLGAPAVEVVSAYLHAYAFRPSRAESLVALAMWYRGCREWALALLFARIARTIAKPDDILFMDVAMYRWQADDETAIAAYWMGYVEASFALCRALLDEDRVPEGERARIEANSHFAVPVLMEKALNYPREIVQRLADSSRPPQKGHGVTLTIALGQQPGLFEETVNSFLHTCQDIERIQRFVCIADNASSDERERLQSLYPFFEFIEGDASETCQALSMNRMLETVTTPYWLYLESGWHFFLSTDYVARALAIFDAEPTAAQVLFNRNYACTLAERSLVGGMRRRHPQSTLRYVMHEYLPEVQERQAFFQRQSPGALSYSAWPHFAVQPSLMRTEAMRNLGRWEVEVAGFEKAFAYRYTAAGWHSAFFDGLASIYTGEPGAPPGAEVLDGLLPCTCE